MVSQSLKDKDGQTTKEEKMSYPVIFGSSIYGNVSIPGGLETVDLLEKLKAFDENILVGVKRGEQVLIIPVTSLDLEAVTLVHEN